MTANDFADFVHGHQIGSGRWKAKCPAHLDRNPSLSIRAGKDGRTLIHCFSGCSVDAILAALKLSRRDLFIGAPPNAEQARQMAVERQQRELSRTAFRRERGALSDRLRKLTIIADSLASKLANTPNHAPNGNALSRIYHDTLGKLRAAEIELENIHET